MEPTTTTTATPATDATDPTAAGKPTRTDRLVLVVRIAMAVVFVFYGSVKLLGGQYNYGEWTISNDEPDGTNVVWSFYGYSKVYGHVTGLFELVPALLLLNRRLYSLGALGLFAVSLNITLMDFCYGYPMVKWFSLAYTLLLAFLVYSDRKRMVAAFWELPPAHGGGRRKGGRRNR